MFLDSRISPQIAHFTDWHNIFLVNGIQRKKEVDCGFYAVCSLY